MTFLILEYFPIFILFVFSSALSFLILGLSFFLSTQKPYGEKISVYESGFDAFEDARNKFDIRFFLVAILFLVFDLETMFLFPWTISLAQLNYLGYWVMVDFLLELVIGFLYIWNLGVLDWE